MAENKSHHFVPQFYLRNFGNERCVAAYNLSRGCHIPLASIKDQCQRTHLYGQDLGFEEALGPLEGAAARVISEIIATGKPPERASADEIHLLYFILLQWRRTPATAAAMTAMANELLRFALPREWRDEGKSLRAMCDLPAVASMQLGGRGVVQALFDLSLKVLVNKTSVEFITSDSPVVLFNQWCQRAWGKGIAALVSRGLQIFLPVSPAHVLVLYDAAVYAVGKRGVRSVAVKKTCDVEGINRLQLMVAEENLYYSGARGTAEEIDRLPFGLRQTQASAVRVEAAPQPDGRSERVYVYTAPPTIKLNVSCTKTRYWARRVPLDQRPAACRGPAVEVLDRALGDGPRSGPRPGGL